MKKAVIFDMDGVIVFSENAYQRRRDIFFVKHGIKLTNEIQEQLVGSNVKDMFIKLIPDDENIRIDLMEKYEDFKSIYPIDYQEILNPDITQSLKELSDMGIRLALASSSSLKSIQSILSENQILDYFELLVSGEMFEKSKPHPEIYQYTVKKLDLDLSDCLVIEDSDIGMSAALNAGLEVTLLNNQNSKSTHHIQSLLEILKYVK